MAVAGLVVFKRFLRPAAPVWPHCRHASTAISDEALQLERTEFSTEEGGDGRIKGYDPVKRARNRRLQLPRSRYQYRSPQFYRGPLHPHQPPPASDPSSRLFVPGPFSYPRLEQTYLSTFASDFMTMSYQHLPPGTTLPRKGNRLRNWEGASPYFANRPLRGPRGAEVLRLLRKRITFNNIPELKRITVHTMSKAAIEDGTALHVAGMVLQAITGQIATPHAARESVASFKIRKGSYLSLTCELRGEEMYHFLSKLIDIVLPKVREWKGVRGSSGDGSGNIAFGLTPDGVAKFPEVEVNYDMYPQKLIPGCHFVIHTSARTDKDARTFLGQIGIPFYGKRVD
ncbi:ribosomal protein L5 [Piedraia hortae CBS 480.64]|uniref:Large ribosomal subunit protein uL5m n=1 Tax=Piedraia hortae CBS 480.64 TaxID=1314780 RepID=A0A6A7BW07_9PEZI|nr:ribosomal protein L5 [Piedraia hortae CBS 480.64]